jgi:hypothetical protein
MHQGDRVRFRPGSRVPASRKVPADSTGTVITSYHLLSRRKPPSRECVDVAFGRDVILWGLQAGEFEVLGPPADKKTR